MYFTMVDHVVDGKTYPRRVGTMTPSFKAAANKAIKKHGYIVDEHGKMVGQAISEHLPKYVGEAKGSINTRLIHIGSGEDCYA